MDSDTAALVAGVARGLLVTDLWYTRVLDPKSLVVTGLTRNGVWLIEDGEVTTAVRNLRFTQSYPQALAPGAVLGVGRHAAPQPDSWSGNWWSAPPVRLASWQFTGGAAAEHAGAAETRRLRRARHRQSVSEYAQSVSEDRVSEVVHIHGKNRRRGFHTGGTQARLPCAGGRCCAA